MVPGMSQTIATKSKKSEYELTRLKPTHKLLAQYLVHGVEHASLAKTIRRAAPTEEEPDRTRPIRANEPLTVEEACQLLGMRRRHARSLLGHKLMREEMNREIEALRSGAKADAMREVIRIAGERGDDSPASRTVQLKAAQMVLGPEASGADGKAGVTVNVGVQLSPGIVIRLPADVSSPPLELEGIEDE